MRLDKLAIKIVLGIIGLYFITSEVIFLKSQDISDYSLFEPLPLFITSLKMTLALIALPALFLMKIINYLFDYFEIGTKKPLSLSAFETELFYKALSLIIVVLIILELTSQIIPIYL